MSSPISSVFNEDNMSGMARYADKYFDLAIVDPPYGIGDRLVNGGGGGGWATMVNSGADKWDIQPGQEYFDELFRISHNQIIWGGNFFDLPPCQLPICWDKVRPNQKNASEWEYAWTSFIGRSRLFSYCANGGFILKAADEKIHPTQKPIALYRWLLSKYAQPGDKILDTHMGSQSSRIAAFQMGFDYTGFELDYDYFIAGNKRFAEQTAQQQLFSGPDPDLYTSLEFDY